MSRINKIEHNYWGIKFMNMFPNEFKQQTRELSRSIYSTQNCKTEETFLALLIFNVDIIDIYFLAAFCWLYKWRWPHYPQFLTRREDWGGNK